MKKRDQRSGRFRIREFWSRVTSAMILVFITLVCTVLGGLWFTALVALLSAAMAREWVRMSDQKAKIQAYGLAIAGLLIPVFLSWYGYWKWALMVLLFSVAASGLETAKRGYPWRAVGGLLYIGLAVLAVLYLRFNANGLSYILYLFAVVWAADSAAYLVGSRVRGPKLWPAISPNKTWSGFAAGMMAGVVAGGIVARLMGLNGGLGLELLSAVLAVISVGGDLLSSWLKRWFGVKDTGASIPGHGGVLDRLDALLAAAMALALFMLFAPWIAL